MKISTMPMLSLVFAMVLGARAQTPTTMCYQGRLTAGGTNFTGTAKPTGATTTR